MTRTEAIEVLRAAGKADELIDEYVEGAEAELGAEYWSTLNSESLLFDFQLFEEARNAST